MCRHQPRSTLSDALVPYTSLFRSGAVLLPGNVVDHQQDPVEPEVVAHVDGGDEVTDVGRVEGASESPEARPPAVAARPHLRNLFVPVAVTRFPRYGCTGLGRHPKTVGEGKGLLGVVDRGRGP